MPPSTAPVMLITGAAKRIGRSIAQCAHRDGYSVCVHYHLSKTEAESVVAELNAQRPGSATAIAANLGTQDAGQSLSKTCEGLIDACFTTFGRCDVLVNCASAYFPTPLLVEDGSDGETAGDVPHVVETNALAPFYLTRAFARRVKDGCGKSDQAPPSCCVVNLCDSMTQIPFVGFSLYTMAKAALEGLTRATAVELAPAGIRVNGVAPGLSCLPPAMSAEDQAAHRLKVPLGKRESTPEEIAEAVLFLASEKAAYVTGTILNVDGGWSLKRS